MKGIRVTGKFWALVTRKARRLGVKVKLGEGERYWRNEKIFNFGVIFRV